MATCGTPGASPSDQSIQIAYAGKPLTSGARVYWRVKVWDQDGQASAWSAPATWSMGLLQPEDWKAKWIGKEETGDQRRSEQPVLEPEGGFVDRTGDAGGRRRRLLPLLVRRAAQDRKVVDAIAVLGGDRGGEFYLNGNRIGKINRYGRPSVATITAALKPGRNVIAVQTSRMAHSPTPG